MGVGRLVVWCVGGCKSVHVDRYGDGWVGRLVIEGGWMEVGRWVGE